MQLTEMISANNQLLMYTVHSIGVGYSAIGLKYLRLPESQVQTLLPHAKGCCKADKLSSEESAV